jgi:hypothetical protein
MIHMVTVMMHMVKARRRLHNMQGFLIRNPQRTLQKYKTGITI